MNKLVNIVCAMLLFGPLAMGFAWDDGAIAHSNKEYYTPGMDAKLVVSQPQVAETDRVID